MDINIVLGVLMLLFGFGTLAARRFAPGSFSKTEAMKKMWGERAGTVLHVLAYTVAPIFYGSMLLYSSLSK